MAPRTKTVLSWSSGKDSAFTLHTLREKSEFEVVSLLTTVTDDYHRISMHGVREELLDLQAEAAGIPLEKIRIPRICSIDPKKLPKDFSGRAFDESLLADLPQEVDPCGENGEFHTFTHGGPIFKKEIPIRQGETVERDGFVFTDFLRKRGQLRQGFPYISSSNALILILGSMPGQKSLEAEQYYAHPHNSFWGLMGCFFGAGRQLEYEKRLQVLKENRIALWDVAFQCRRNGSLDSNIREVTPNPFGAFFDKHPMIHSVFFNGQKAEQLFTKLILNNLGERVKKLRFVRLPSTSPAHASLSRDQKKARWHRELKTALTSQGKIGKRSRLKPHHL